MHKSVQTKGFFFFFALEFAPPSFVCRAFYHYHNYLLGQRIPAKKSNYLLFIIIFFITAAVMIQSQPVTTSTDKDLDFAVHCFSEGRRIKCEGTRILSIAA